MLNPQLKHRPDVCEKGIVVARVSPHAVDIHGRSIEFRPVRILQTDTEIQPRPKRRAAVTEWQIGELENPAGAVRTSGKCAVKRRIRSAANRDPPGSKAPRSVIDIGS
jgi:hypothetical protein